MIVKTSLIQRPTITTPRQRSSFPKTKNFFPKITRPHKNHFFRLENSRKLIRTFLFVHCWYSYTQHTRSSCKIPPKNKMAITGDISHTLRYTRILHTLHIYHSNESAIFIRTQSDTMDTVARWSFPFRPSGPFTLSSGQIFRKYLALRIFTTTRSAYRRFIRNTKSLPFSDIDYSIPFVRSP